MHTSKVHAYQAQKLQALKVTNIGAYIDAQQNILCQPGRITAEGKLMVSYDGIWIPEKEFRQRMPQPNSLLSPILNKGDNPDGTKIL